jgi:hypothetical protein
MMPVAALDTDGGRALDELFNSLCRCRDLCHQAVDDTCDGTE